jgi:hypothetical protein
MTAPHCCPPFAALSTSVRFHPRLASASPRFRSGNRLPADSVQTHLGKGLTCRPVKMSRKKLPMSEDSPFRSEYIRRKINPLPLHRQDWRLTSRELCSIPTNSGG